MRSLTFAWRNSKSGFLARSRRWSREPVMKLSRLRTPKPRTSSASHRCEPMNPAPPDTTARGLELVAADAPVSETKAAHDHRVVDVAAVDNHRPPHRGLHASEVEVAELVPLGDHDHGVGAGRD